MSKVGKNELHRLPENKKHRYKQEMKALKKAEKLNKSKIVEEDIEEEIEEAVIDEQEIDTVDDEAEAYEEDALEEGVEEHEVDAAEEEVEEYEEDTLDDEAEEYEEDIVEEDSEEYVDDVTEESGNKIFSLFKNPLKYFVITAVALIYWEIIMMVKMGGANISNLFFLAFIPAEALAFTTLCGIGNKLSSRITLPVVLAIPSVYYIVQTIYLRNFGSLFSVSMAGMGEDAVNDFGWAVEDAVKASVFTIVLILLPVILAIVFAIKDVIKLSAYKWYLHFGTLLLVVIFWFIGVLFIRCFGTQRLSPYYMLTSDAVTTDATARKLGVLTTGIVESGSYYFGIHGETGNDFIYEEIEEQNIETTLDNEEEEDSVVRNPWINEALDFKKMAEEADDPSFKSLATFFANREPSTTNEYTGMFEGYNLIYICAESFWNYGCNEKVTPTLYKMANNGIVLNNYYNSFYNTTTNGEFAFDTSLWPDVSRHSANGTDIGSFAQSASKYMPQGLGDLFTAQGIPSYGFHNYYGKYYRRILSWPNLGYKTRFTGDRGMYFTSNWPASDYELMVQTVDDYINDDQFHAYYMTFSGHGPYTTKNGIYRKNISTVNSILGTESMNDMARGYLAGELELDKAMEYLLNRLEEAGKLDNTVIVLTGDHYPYYLDSDSRDSLVGFKMDETFDIYHSNCMIYNAGIKEPIYVDSYCSNIDIVPTVLNLFNIPFESRLMMGRDIFSKEAHNRGTLYNQSFVTDLVKYNYETGTAIWTDKGNELSAEEKSKYIEKQLNNIENEYTAACRVIEENFFLEAYKRAGLLTPEEVEEELKREENVHNQDMDYNAEDEEKAAQRAAEREAKAALEAAIANGLTDLNGDGLVDENDLILFEAINQNNLPLDGTLPAGDPNALPVDGIQVADPNAANAVDPATQGATVADPNAVNAANPATQAAPAVDANAANPAGAVADPNAANAAPAVDTNAVAVPAQ